MVARQMIVLCTISVGQTINLHRGEYPNFKIMGGVIYIEYPAHVNPKKFKKKIKKILKKNYSNPLIISTFKNFIYFIKNNCLIIWICQILYLSLQLVELEIQLIYFLQVKITRNRRRVSHCTLHSKRLSPILQKQLLYKLNCVSVYI